MTKDQDDVRPSLISELLLYHAVLGRGYISPFPATKGLTFSSALPIEALSVLASAETQFRRWHDDETASDRKTLEMLELTPEAVTAVTGGDKLAGKKLKEKLSRRPHITWKEDQVMKSTLVELLKTHYYGAMTYVDAVGARLGASLSHSTRLAGDLGWVTLTEGTTDETLIRANSNGGACIHSLAGSEAIFNFFCSCKTPHIEKLAEKIKDTAGGQVGIGTTVLIQGYPGKFSGVTSATLYSLARRVFASGAKDDDCRVRVVFDASCKAQWEEFLGWGLADLLEEKTPSAWQWKLSLTSAASVRTSILFGARAGLVAAFLKAAETSPDAPLRLVELDAHDLRIAQAAARSIYISSSGSESFDRRVQNLKPAKENFITPAKLSIAKLALEEALKAAPSKRLARSQIRRGDAPGATLGLLDELVKTGDIIELSGMDECQMGRTTRAYVLPQDAPPCDEIEALDEYQEALENFATNPDAFVTGEALIVVRRLREKAEALNAEHMLPAVPLSRMSKLERRMLPQITSLFPSSFFLRGEALGDPEPSKLMEDDDVPLDRGVNLWVRHRTSGDDFCDWDLAGMLKLGDRWGAKTEQIAPSIDEGVDKIEHEHTYDDL